MVDVRVNGTTFQNFTQIDVTRSVDDFSGEGRIVTSVQPNNLSFLRIGDLVEILLDGVLVLTGYAEAVDDTESSGSHDVSFRLRDKVGDIIDSNVPDNVKSLEGVADLAELCRLVADGLGVDLEVIERIEAAIAGEFKAASVGQNAFDFLDAYARKAQVFLQSDGAGNILIQRPSGELSTILAFVKGFAGNNIKSSAYELDESKRFHTYRVRSNGNVAEGDEEQDNSGEAVDDEIRAGRLLEIIASEPMTSDECQRAAEEERNVRRARGFQYSCTVAGFSANGQLWYPGRKVQIRDDEKQISGEFLTRTVSWEFSQSGEVTTIDVAPKGSYDVRELPPAEMEKTSQEALTYTVAPGDKLYAIAQEQGVDLSALISANPQIENPDLILPDQIINIPVTGGDVT